MVLIVPLYSSKNTYLYVNINHKDFDYKVVRISIKNVVLIFCLLKEIHLALQSDICTFSSYCIYPDASIIVNMSLVVDSDDLGNLFALVHVRFPMPPVSYH